VTQFNIYSEKIAASLILYPEDGGNKYLQIDGTYLPPIHSQRKKLKFWLLLTVRKIYFTFFQTIDNI
jgi:hypothetical protein